MAEEESEKFTGDAINEYILEIRYKPNPKILDHRGRWGETLSKITELPHWRISEIRIDVHDHEKDPEKAMERCFISYKNAGYVVRNCSSGNAFYKKYLKLHQFIFSNEDVFGKDLLLHRIGVKIKIGTKFDGTFDEILKIYSENYLVPNEKLSTVFDADIADIGGYVTFRTKDDVDIQSMSGPMEEEQIKQFFPFVEDPPNPIFYFEIDSSIKPNEELNGKRIEKIIGDLIRLDWSTNNKVIKMLLGE